MTCASCANRIERKLDGVTATVNYATEKAKVTYPEVTYPEGLGPEELLATVEQAGYHATLAQGSQR
ncbi:MAG TPA: heavy metal-associated domain-containing protein [Nocardioidaceae bacterium]|nr:heavy metal-associated domain-containing protein [Nocardioidaceae bacterium]